MTTNPTRTVPTTAPAPAARPGVWARLRRPQSAEVVAVTVTGHPAAVAAVACALASVTVVSGMSHRVGDSDTTVVLEATCHPAARAVPR